MRPMSATQLKALRELAVGDFVRPRNQWDWRAMSGALFPLNVVSALRKRGLATLYVGKQRMRVAITNVGRRYLAEAINAP